MNDSAVADGKADSPSWHAITLGKREKLHPKLFGAGNLQKTGRLITVEGKIRVGEIVHDDQVMLLGKANDPLEESQLHNFRGRIMRETNDQQLWLWPCLLDRLFEMTEEGLASRQRNTTKI